MDILCQQPSTLAMVALLGCGVFLCAPRVQAASEEVLTAARACAELDWRDEGGHERAEIYRGAVDCFKALYVRVAAGKRSSPAFNTALTQRLDKLEAAYRLSRDVCGLRTQLESDAGGCGTLSLSAHEFIFVLKIMILNEDAGWVKHDPALATALRLDE